MRTQFMHFCQSYQRLTEAQGVLLSFSVHRLIPYYASEYYAARGKILENLKAEIERNEFLIRRYFPRTLDEVEKIEEFDYQSFFHFLKGHREIAQKNENSLKLLLEDLSVHSDLKVPTFEELTS